MKEYPFSLTEYDVVKSLGLLLLILDLIGTILFPTNPWFHVFGKGGYVITFFLAGFGNTRKISSLLLLSAMAIIGANIVGGGQLLPFNILVTVIVCRLLVNKVSSIAFKNWEVCLYMSFFVAVLTIATFIFFDAGTTALLIAMAGYLSRRKEETGLSTTSRKVFMGFTVVFFALFELLILHLAKFEAQAMIISMGAIAIMLYYFTGKEIPEWEERVPSFLVSALQFTGRYNLQIFVAVNIGLILLACVTGHNKYGWFNWETVK